MLHINGFIDHCEMCDYGEAIFENTFIYHFGTDRGKDVTRFTSIGTS